MKKLSLLMIVLFLFALIPSSAFASVPVFYCSYDAAPGGDGSYDAPWQCANSDQLAAVVAEVCKSGYAILYQTVDTGYYRHTIEDPVDGACKVTSSVFYQGTPPDTGIALPAPLLVGMALTLGAALVAGGYFVYRKRYA